MSEEKKTVTEVNYDELINLLKNNHEVLTADNYTELDGIILAELSGSNFSSVIPSGADVGDYSLSYLCKALARKLSEDDPKRALLLAIAQSDRYSKVTVTDPINTEYGANDDDFQQFNGEYYDSETGTTYRTDFKAVTYHLGDGEPGTMLIAFAGTGASVYSWIEDLRLSYTDYGIGAQEQAAAYFKYVADKYPNKEIKMAGYSKGGNLMIYAAAKHADEYAHRITDLKNFDGPGVKTSLLYNEDGSLTQMGEAYQKIREKLTNYSPKNSFVGKLMKNWEEYIFIDDLDVIFPVNHDYHNWKLKEDGSFGLEISPGGDTQTSKAIDDVIEHLLGQMSDEEMIALCDFLEEFCRKNEIETLTDLGNFFSGEPLVAIDKLLTFYANHPDKEAVSKFITTLLTYDHLTQIIEAFLWDKMGVLSKLDLFIQHFDLSDFLLNLGVVVGSFLVAGFLIKESFELLCEEIKKKVDEAVDWVQETAEKIYIYLTVEVPKKIEAFIDKATAYVENKIEQLKNAYNEMKEKVLNTCKDVYKKAKNFVKNQWARVKKWTFVYGTVSVYTRYQVDTAKLREYFNSLTGLRTRIQNLDDSLHTLYSRLCINDIEDGEVLTSLANLYHLVRSDIIVDDAWRVSGCRTRLYGLICSFETIERTLNACLNG